MDGCKSEALDLLQYLVHHGQKVTQGEYKLTITSAALSFLNNLFHELGLNSCKYDASMNNRQQLIYSKLSFENIITSFNILKMVSYLKVIHGIHTVHGKIDLTLFENIKCLELHKVPIHLLVGLHQISSQIISLTCQRSIRDLRELFVNWIDEENSVWPALKELNINHNYIKEIDKSLALLGNIVHLDISYNEIADITAVQVLEKLEYLNVGYNNLVNVPSLSCQSLKYLYMQNNFLENLHGLEILHYLEVLDIRHNLISMYSSLEPLSQLYSLSMLCLEGNPFYFHPKYRQLVSKHLCAFVLNRGILLDKKMLSCDVLQDEDKCEGTESFIFDASEFNLETCANTNNCSTEASPIQTSGVSPPPACVTENSSIAIESDYHPQLFQKKQKLKTMKQTLPKIRKIKHKPKEASIFESSEYNESEEEKPDGGSCQEPCGSADSHIQSKQVLKSRRESFYEGWLVPTENFSTLVVSSDSSSSPDTHTQVFSSYKKSSFSKKSSSDTQPSQVFLNAEGDLIHHYCSLEVSRSSEFSSKSDFVSSRQSHCQFENATTLTRPGGINENIHVNNKADLVTEGFKKLDLTSEKEFSETVESHSGDKVEQNFELDHSSSINTIPNSSEKDDKTPSAGEIEESELLEYTFEVEECVGFSQISLEKELVSFETFTSPDHRLRLFLEEYVFQKNENFVACLKTSVLPLPACEAFQSIIIVTSTRFLVLTDFSDSSDVFEHLKVVYAVPLQTIARIKVFLGSQGFSVSTIPDNRIFLCLIKDSDLCSTFIHILSGTMNLIHEEFKILGQFLDCHEDVKQITDEVFDYWTCYNRNKKTKEEILLHMFADYCIEGHHGGMASVIVTNEHIYLSRLMFPKENESDVYYHYEPVKYQSITDLTKMILDKTLKKGELHFEDEDGNKYPSWTLCTPTKSSLINFISYVKKLWDALFQTNLLLFICEDKD